MLFKTSSCECVVYVCFICVHMYLWVHMCLYVCTCMCREEVNIGRSLQSVSILLFLREGLSVNPELTDLAKLPGQQVQGILWSLPPKHAGIKEVYTYAYLGAGDTNICLHIVC